MLPGADTPPTILLVAEDLLTALLTDHLRTQGYRVATPDPYGTAQIAAQSLPIDLILAEVRYPYEPCLDRLKVLRTLASEPDIPLVLIGYGPSTLHHVLEGRVTWLEGGASVDTIMTAVARWSAQHPNPAAPLLRARPLAIGQHPWEKGTHQ